VAVSFYMFRRGALRDTLTGCHTLAVCGLRIKNNTGARSDEVAVEGRPCGAPVPLIDAGKQPASAAAPEPAGATAATPGG